MLGSDHHVHFSYGFFMNWFGQRQGEGYEYHLLIIGIAAALLVTGAGRWSVDREIAERIA
jgi:putative oxidoreductase